jgi:two-component system response regulator RegX3
MRTLERVTTDTVEAPRIVPLRVADGPQPNATVVLVEAEPLLADSIKYTLERDGYRVVAPATREAALEVISAERPALVVAELATPSAESLELWRTVRASTAASILLITPWVSEADRAAVLQAGADDLLVKPFSVRELAHRVAQQVRRERAAVAAPRDSDTEILRVGPVEMDVANHEVRVRGELTVFPPKEFGLLETLLRSRGRLLTRARLIATVWGADYYGDGKTLDTHVKRLREKIELDPRRPAHLIVVRGLGYRFLESAR